MIYLDSSATSPIDPRVRDAMWPYLSEEFGNPSSKYYTLAENAKAAVKKSRRSVATLLNCDEKEVIFTSGSTESNNFVLKGIAHYYKPRGKHIITSNVEHKSILETCEFLEGEGFDVTYLEVNKQGYVEEETLRKALREDTILVSIMWGNNEIGTLNNIKNLLNLVKEYKEEIFFHTDATQVVGKISVNLADVPVDFLSLSAHKLYGPKGIGACFIRHTKLGLRTKLTPLLHGGSQEDGYRSGTLSVHNIVGLGVAADIVKDTLADSNDKIISLENILKEKLQNEIPQVIFNGDNLNKIPGILNITIPGTTNELIIRSMKDEYALSTGSACSINEPSYVLSGIGLDSDLIESSFRICINKYVQENELINFVDDLNKTIQMYSI